MSIDAHETAYNSVHCGRLREAPVFWDTEVAYINHAGAVRKVREELFSTLQPPTSTLLVISELAGPDYLVEIEAIAVVE